MVERIRSQLRNQWMGALALFLVLAGGGAYAAFDPIGNDGDIDACFQRRSGDLDLLKGKRCGRDEKPFSWSQIGPQGEPGQQGPPGDTGAPGTSIFDGTIPSGETVTGAWGGEFANASNTPLVQAFAIGFPVKAPSLLTSAQVNTAPHPRASDPDSACTGSLGAPTAPPGKVCIYVDDITNPYVTVEGLSLVSPSSDPAAPGDDLGFLIRASYNPTGSGQLTTNASGTWAYTAP